MNGNSQVWSFVSRRADRLDSKETALPMPILKRSSGPETAGTLGCEAGAWPWIGCECCNATVASFAHGRVKDSLGVR